MSTDPPLDGKNPEYLIQILLLLQHATGQDFMGYKKSLISRVVERHMEQRKINNPVAYKKLLSTNPAEIQYLLNALLINVTRFFRDPEAFDVLQSEVIPKLIQDKKNNAVIRIWIAGCATGEEAYSIAILFREYMNRNKQEFNIQIYATDLDQDAITTARAGFYPDAIKKEVNLRRQNEFFTQEKQGLRINSNIREMVVFAIQNILKNPAFIKLDLICCRNLMIYLEAELQNKLIRKFNFALRRGGILFLSPAESIGDNTNMFTVFNRKFKMYQALKSETFTKILRAQ